MNLDRGSFYNKGISPQQRIVVVLRWNPSISSFSSDDFEDEFAQLQGRDCSIYQLFTFALLGGASLMTHSLTN